ncbi:IucA/IucC family protein [Stappia sp.]|uniref:IucA/IucC family protein n=1 Tax=Stappia sp. TaxID=1870903 RepID=UPI003A994967
MDDMSAAMHVMPPQERAAAHLEGDRWAWVNRLLVRKAISEFSHELLLLPRLVGPAGDQARYVLEQPSEHVEYRFLARRLRLDHWQVDAASIEKRVNGKPAPIDALKFIIEFRKPLGIRDAMMPVYLDEISSILYGSAYKAATKPHRASDLAVADFQAIETGMTEGHPSFVANNGRLGFNTADYPLYAPEAAGPLSIVWVAVSREHARFVGMAGLDHDRLMAEELGEQVVSGYRKQLAGAGHDPDDYLFMPVHPWQWFNRISMSFAAEIARGNIVYLGLSEDLYQPQQSIRTFFNATSPSKRYVKMALSILNMGFMLQRGLSPEDMRTTPEINEWLRNLLARDSYLQKNGFCLICEVATISYRNPYYEEGLSADSPYKDVLAALWRESPVNLIRPGERLMTMAALLHLDPQGDAMTGALIGRSGLGAEEWIRRYLRAYFAPVLHCYYAYDIIFMPHGENVILILENDAPTRIVMKDLAEEMRILNDGAGLPPVVRRNCVVLDDEVRLDGIFTDVFDCYFRHLAAILDERGILEEGRFWGLVAECAATYQAAHPQYAEKFARHDVFAREFPRNCINRLQLRDNRQLLDPNDPDKGFEYAGTLENPISRDAIRNGTSSSAMRRALGHIATYFVGPRAD